jgi:hypothetical protein
LIKEFMELVREVPSPDAWGMVIEQLSRDSALEFDVAQFHKVLKACRSQTASPENIAGMFKKTGRVAGQASSRSKRGHWDV